MLAVSSRHGCSSFAALSVETTKRSKAPQRCTAAGCAIRLSKCRGVPGTLSYIRTHISSTRRRSKRSLITSVSGS